MILTIKLDRNNCTVLACSPLTESLRLPGCSSWPPKGQGSPMTVLALLRLLLPGCSSCSIWPPKGEGSPMTVLALLRLMLPGCPSAASRCMMMMMMMISMSSMSSMTMRLPRSVAPPPRAPPTPPPPGGEAPTPNSNPLPPPLPLLPTSKCTRNTCIGTPNPVEPRILCTGVAPSDSSSKKKNKPKKAEPKWLQASAWTKETRATGAYPGPRAPRPHVQTQHHPAR